MQRLWRTNIFVQCGVAAFLFWGNAASAFEMTIPGDQNVSIFNDAFWTRYFKAMTSGDFNGDGKNDLVVGFQDGSGGLIVYIFCGPSWKTSDLFSSRADFQIIAPFPLEQDVSMLLADIDGDGKQDLIFRLSTNYWRSTGSYSAVLAVRGRPTTSDPVIDLSETSPDLLLLLPGGRGGLASGKFNEDIYADIAIGDPSAQPLGRPSAGAGYIFFGQETLPSGEINVQSGAPVSTFIGKSDDQLGGVFLTEDLDRNGITDLSIDGHIFYGPLSFPMTWDLAVTSANVLIQGGTVVGIEDLNGDNKPDFLCGVLPTPAWLPSRPRALLDGQALSPGRHLIDLTPGSPHYYPTVLLSGETDRFDSIGDFDGDGLGDLFLTRGVSGVYGELSLDRGTGPLTAVSTPTVTMTFLSRMSFSGMVKDLDGDGIEDFAIYESFGQRRPPSNSQGVVHIVFGFAPLTTPCVEIVPRATPSLQVGLTLHVGGQPTEMMIWGDITDSFKGQWIPFQPTLPVTLTSAPGKKTVQAKFRNSVLRESDLASDTWDLSLEPGRITVVTNRFNPENGQKARFECHLESPSEVHATVHDTNGRIVRDIIQGDQATGILALEWDGANNDGRRVVPGVYYLVMRINGRVEREKIVVRG